MKLRLLLVLVCTLLTVSACVVVPFDNGGRGDQHEYGRRVWR